LHDAVREIKQRFFAIDEQIESLGNKMELFTSEVFITPKVILLYGPPGTGKAAIA